MAQPTFTAPLPLLLDLNGNGLSGGSVYIGVAGSDPQTFPQTVYWDAAGTIPASQPLATQSGYFVNAGNVAQIYGPTNYSIRVLDSNGVLVFYQPTVSNSLAGPLTLAANGLTVGTTQLVTASGNVGVGTATPTDTLTVAGTLRMENASVAAQYAQFGVANNKLYFVTNAVSPTININTTTTLFRDLADTTTYLTVSAAGVVSTGAISDAAGSVRGVPQTAIAGNFTLALTQLGYKIKLTNAGAQTVTIPTNAAVAFGTDAIITLVNRGTTAASIALSGGVTLIQAGTGATGARTLAVNGMCSLIKNDTDEWMISGSGVS